MTSDSIADYNRLQREYFGQRIKKTMLPVRTPYVQRQVTEVVRVGCLRPGEKVLDVGCGMGRHAFLLAEKGLNVEGLELSPFLAEKMREFDRGKYRIPVHCADLHDPPRELEGRYDAVVGFFVLHHLASLQRAFSGVKRLLKAGGRAVFLEPNPANPLYYLQVLLTPGMRWAAEKGIRNMRGSALWREAKAAGMRLEKLERYGFFPPFVANRWWGGIMDRKLERVRILHPILPFQLFFFVRSDGFDSSR
ncbi:MAG: class I SAM-dependent methyltransferase [Thermoanaerobaculum sp.]